MKSKLHINTIAMLISFLTNLSITFFVSPVIVEYVGSEAYAFVKLATDFTNYASIISVAINSVSARYVTIEYHKGNFDNAIKYFNSVFWCNVFLSLIFGITGSIIIINLDSILQIPSNLLNDVRLLFIFMFANFLLSIISTIFTVATYITNTLYLSSIANAIACIIKVCFVTVAFKIFLPSIWILGMANCLYTILYGLANYKFKKKILPQFNLSIKLFSWSKTIRMIKSGIWSSISGIGNILSDGLDLLISNLFLGGTIMGQLSLSKTVSSMISSLLGSIANLFAPELTLYYAKDDTKSILEELTLAMKFTGFVGGIFFCVFLIMGESFFILWVPSENAKLIYQYAMLCTVSVLVSGVVSPLNSVFVLTDHLKTNSIVWLSISFLDIGIVYLLIQKTTFGGYAIAGVSSIVGAIVNLTYLPIICCRYLKIEIKDIYFVITRYFFATLIGIMLLKIVDFYWNISTLTWGNFFIKTFCMVLIMSISNYFVLLTKNERKQLKIIFAKKISGRGK